MIYRMTKMSGKGDEMVTEWTDTVSPDRLAWIEIEFKEMMKKGYIPADLETNEIIREFKPDTNILMIPKMSGGSN